MLHEKTQLPVTWVLGGACVVLALLIYLFSGLRAITTLVAVIYPAWCSLKAIRSDDKNDDTLWLCYWVFYGIVSVIESITDLLLFWIPMYELVKMAFYVYLYQLEGAIFLYDKLLRPLVEKGEKYESDLKKSAKKFENVMDTATASKQN